MNMKKVFLSTLLVCLPVLSWADIEGKVIAVSDGDTIRVLTPEKQEVRVRMLRIDAPESSQAFGQRSRQNLNAMAYGKNVRVVQDGKSRTDKYQRVLGTVYVNGVNLNYQQVKDGYAWADRYFEPTQKFIMAEAEAKKFKKGLWIEPNPVEPWNYRRK